MKALALSVALCALFALSAGAAVDGPLFNTSMHLPALLTPEGACIADYDQDGMNDIAVTCENDGEPGVVVYIGQGKGAFESMVGCYLAFPVSRLKAADLNGDDYPDLVGGGSSGVYILLNNGDGTFGTTPLAGVAGSPNQVFLSDLNGDGDQDLVVAHDENAVYFTSMYVGLGDGTFFGPYTFTTSNYQRGLFVADLTGDNRGEIVVSCPNDQAIYVLTNDGGGNFSTAVDYTFASFPNHVSGADFDDDGDIDLVVGMSSGDIIIMANDGGTFTVDGTYEVIDIADDIAVADFDGVNGPDVVLSYDSVQVLFNDGNGAFNTFRTYQTGPYANFLAVGQLDNNESYDIVTTNQTYYGPGQVSILFNDGGGDFWRTEDVPSTDAQGVVTYDFDGDGDLDIATGGYQTDRVYILTNDGTGQYTVTNDYACVENIWRLALGDVDGVNGPDIIVSSWSLGALTVLKSNGNGTFQAAASYPVGTGAIGIFAADLDNDSDVDLVSVDRTDYTISILENLSNTGFATRVTQAIASYSYNGSIDGEDLNDDGLIDLVIADYNNDRVEILWNGGGLDFSSAGAVSACYEAYEVCVEDLDLDGNPDIIVSSYDSSEVAFIRNLNPGFAPAVFYHGGWENCFMTTGDFDDDGLPDVAILDNEAYHVSVFLNEGSFTFGNVTGYGFPGQDGEGICAGDFDDDGYVDLAVADYDNGQISILWNRYEILTPVTEIEFGDPLPQRFTLGQNYPNPFNPSTTVIYSLPVSANVKIAIYNLLGQRIRTFNEGLMPAGEHSVVWDGRDEGGRSVATGLYFYKMTAGDYTESRKMLLLK